MTDKSIIEKYAVRIDVDGAVGSGFLYTSLESQYVYIFTVYHVIKNWKSKEVQIQYQGKKVSCENIEYCIMESTLEVAKEGYFEGAQFKSRKEDVAVLRILKSCFDEDTAFPEEVLCITENLIKEKDFEAAGYPNRKTIVVPLCGTIIKWDEEDGMFFCQAENIDHPEFAEAMSGFSGTGLLIKEAERLVLAGLVLSCECEEKHKIFCAVGISEIREKMQEMGWEVPELLADKRKEESNRTPDSFFEADLCNLIMEYIEDTEPDINKAIEQKIYLINRKANPKLMEQNERFFEVPICEKQERKVCARYWAGRLFSLLLLEYVNGDIEKNKCVLGDGKEVNIEFICSEGNGKADIGSVVASAVNKKVLGEQIKGDSILIWQSNKNPKMHIFKRRKFRRIVGDIASSNLKESGEETGYHLLNGEMKQKDYGILHINKLFERLNNCITVEEMEETIREVLNDVWE